MGEGVSGCEWWSEAKGSMTIKDRRKERPLLLLHEGRVNEGGRRDGRKKGRGEGGKGGQKEERTEGRNDLSCSFMKERGK